MELDTGVSGAALVTILWMALVTYATRAGGLWLMGRMKPAGRLERGLRHVPGSVLVAIVIPAALAAGPAGLLGVLVTALVAGRSGSLLLAMLVGVGSVWALRNLL